MRVVIVGAGGHGQVMADALLRATSPAVDVAGFVDDRADAGSTIMGLPVLGAVAALASFPHDAIVVAVGDNARRRELCDRFDRAGERLVSVVHPSAIVGIDVVLEDGVMICAGAVVNTGSRLGKGAIINTAASVDHHSVIETCAHIAPGVHMGGEVHVGEGALVGVGAAVLPRRRIGHRATVGAGAVVTRDVADDERVVGNPARAIRRKPS